MCGIAGFFGTPAGPLPPRPLLAAMIAALRHRGPDGEGLHAEAGIGLAHARLSIIDQAGGAQPMSSADGTIWVSFNGEIFNFVELRRELEARGRRFRTRSDTEVILHLYEEMGVDCLAALNGDFALALWDGRRRQLVLARDRMGVRPLFYAERGGCLYFASEVKALLQVPGIEAELDPVALDQIFTFWFPLAPRTPFQDIFELPPAHVLVATPERREIRPYWRLDFPDAGDDTGVDGRGEAAIAEEVAALVQDATRIRLRADVPVGAYLSGGLDSAIVAAAAKRLAPDRLHSFSVTFETPEFDESPYQDAMVAALGTQHRAVACSAADIAASFPDVVRHAERPILRTAPAPLYALADLVRRDGFKVVLTGEGADEVFAGYDIFKEAKLRRFCASQPQSRRRPLLLRRLYPYLPRLQGQSDAYLAAFFAAAPGDADHPLFSHLPRFRTAASAKLFYSPELKRQLAGYDAVAELADSLPADFARWHPLSQAQYLETAHLLPGYILSSQGDRMAMAHGVEGRFPFLDHRLVELAARIPPRLKLRGLREKHILRQATRHLLPAAIADRPKQPYRAPESQCFFGAAAPAHVGEALSAAEIADAGWFDGRAVARLQAKCAGAASLTQRDNSAFVGILSTQLWRRAFRRPAPALAGTRDRQPIFA